MTSHVGTYLLQWKFFEKPAMHTSPLDDVIDSMTTHKAKVMYYYETLNSVDYRGSMTSLQSCNSGFSTISKVSWALYNINLVPLVKPSVRPSFPATFE